MDTSNNTLLVANRGEIAVRVFRTAKRLGFRTVAVYSDADEGALHVRCADDAVHIGPALASESYLNRERIIEAARTGGATLVHPGYGFLAEDDRFADACERAGLTFVGPPAAVLRAVGDKAAARVLAERAGVRVLPGYAGDDQSDDGLRGAAKEIGYPVLLKPAGGGGGKGMHVVRAEDELDAALSSARRVSRAAFDDDRLILERYVESPRHIEVQIFADTHGSVVHLGERDCSLQRRHQKVMEEAPAPNLDEALRGQIHDAAVSFARAADYRGAGTCEFVVGADGTFGFIEMNARLQVEHPVTEAVTGLDLVELQLRVAQGEPLPELPATPHGHAIEVRVYAEDPDQGFLPQSGRIEHLRWPAHPARVDTGFEAGSDVTTFYDPLLAKIITSGRTRDDALHALRDALAHTEVLGVRTNVTFLRTVLDDDTVADGRVTTDWLERAYGDWEAPRDPARAAKVAARGELARIASVPDRDPWAFLQAWRANGRHDARIVLREGTDEHTVALNEVSDEGVAVRGADGRSYVWLDGVAYEFEMGPAPRRLGASASHLDAPLPGLVIAVNVASGEHVSKGAELVVVEAMKMEHAVKAPSDGTVRTVLCAQGDQVARGQTLVDFEPD